MLSSFGTVLLISKSLGVSQFADYALLLSVQGFLLLFQNTLGPGILYSMSRNPGKVFQVARVSLLLRTGTALLLCILLMTAAPFLVTLLHYDRIHWGLYFYIGLQSFFFSIERHLLQLCQSEGYFSRYSIIAFGARSLKFTAILILFFMQLLTLESILLSIAATQLFALIPGFVLIRKSLWSTTPIASLYRKILHYSRWVLVTEFFVFLGTRANVIILSFFLENKALSAWALAETMLQALMLLSQSINAVLSPKILNPQTQPTLKSWFQTSLILFASYGIIAIISTIILRPIIEMCNFTQLLQAVPLYYTLVPGVWIYMSATYSILYLHRFKQTRILFGMEVISAISLVGGNIIIVPMYGIQGAALSFCISRFLYSICIIISVRNHMAKKW